MLAFLSDETGAVTVDWVVLTAAAVGMAIGVMNGIDENVDAFANSVGNAIGNQTSVLP